MEIHSRGPSDSSSTPVELGASFSCVIAEGGSPGTFIAGSTIPTMAVSDDMIRQARKSDRAAVEMILTDSYPAVHRMAHALTGDTRRAGKIVRFVLRQGVKVMPRWRKGITPENWFYHHTLLAAREAAPTAPAPAEDLLITAGPTGQPAYAAFVRALRALPRQQMEAFIIHHGERLNLRLLGATMDCSTTAATTHLNAATDALKTIAVESFPALTAALARAYTTLSPPETTIRTAVAQQAATALWLIRLRRWVRRTVWICILALLAWAVWHWHAVLLQWIDAVRSKAQTQPT